MPGRSHSASQPGAQGPKQTRLEPQAWPMPNAIPQQMTSPSLDEKIAFFDRLDALDRVTDGDDEIDQSERDHRDKCRAFFRPMKKAKPSDDETAPLRPRRTVSMPTPSASTPGARVIEATPGTRNPAVRRLADPELTTALVEETPVPDTARQAPAALRRSTTFPLPTAPSTAEQSPSVSSALRKRRRQPSTKSVPEAAQIFRGLSFYYIPNNDISPARRLRISRAREYGARWVRSLADASHVVVDRDLQYKDIESLLGSRSRSSLIVVNEEYPIDCISFRLLLNPDQHRYRVPGHDALKAPRGFRKSGPGETPPGSEPSPRCNVPQLGHGCANQTLADTSGESPVPANPSPPPAPSEREDESGGLSNRVPRRTSTVRDELSEYIDLMQQYKDLPLDAEDDDVQSVADFQEYVSGSDVDEVSDGERARKRRPAKTRGTARKEITFEDRFACNRGGTKDKSADGQNPNARTIEVLQSMCDYYTRISDHWRTLAYRKAIATLRRQTVKITTEEEAYRLPNIGRRLAAKIEEIACTNKLRRLEYAGDEPLDHVLETFLKIYDVGVRRANKWIAQGFRTLDDLREKADLTTNQRIGIEHYDDLNTRIPRDEITALFAYVQREAAQLDPSVELLVGGSYRRGSDSSGDMDVIVTKRGTDSSAELVPFLEELVTVLTRKGFLVATLAALRAHRPGKDGPGSKWHGCCVLPREDQGADDGDGAPLQVWRRIDFLLVPESEYGAALIYFTGNDIFNRSMRLLASKKGMKLNQRGLYKGVMPSNNRAQVAEGELVEGRDEKRIFELLGVKWREPWERWC